MEGKMILENAEFFAKNHIRFSQIASKTLAFFNQAFEENWEIFFRLFLAQFLINCRAERHVKQCLCVCFRLLFIYLLNFAQFSVEDLRKNLLPGIFNYLFLVQINSDFRCLLECVLVWVYGCMGVYLSLCAATNYVSSHTQTKPRAY